MTHETTFRIHLPTLFAEVNQQRRREGLPEVEPAVMAVRASIKFAIRQRKYVNFNTDDVHVDEHDAGQLCEALGELFNVRLNLAPGGGRMGAIVEESAPFEMPEPLPMAAGAGVAAAPAVAAIPAAVPHAVFELPLLQFYAEINRARRARGLLPVEPAVISVRTGVKFAILRKRRIDFEKTRVPLDEADLAALEHIIAQQFDVRIPGGLVSLCEESRPVGVAHHAPSRGHSEEHGVVSRLFERFSGGKRQARHYSINTNNLLLAILKRRTIMGHRPILPETVRTRCAEALRIELELETDLHNHELDLRGEQLDHFADIIRREFQIVFDDMEDLMK